MGEEVRDGEQAEFAWVLHPAALQCAKVIGIAKFAAQLLKDLPIPLLQLMPDLLLQVAAEIICDPIIVQQRVVHVEEKDEIIRHGSDCTGALARLVKRRLSR